MCIFVNKSDSILDLDYTKLFFAKLSTY